MGSRSEPPKQRSRPSPPTNRSSRRRWEHASSIDSLKHHSGTHWPRLPSSAPTGAPCPLTMSMFRALKAVVALWVGIALYGVTSGNWSLAGGSAALAAVLAAAYWLGHMRDPQRRW
jgi:hypothetical protein